MTTPENPPPSPGTTMCSIWVAFGQGAPPDKAAAEPAVEQATVDQEPPRKARLSPVQGVQRRTGGRAERTAPDRLTLAWVEEHLPVGADERVRRSLRGEWSCTLWADDQTRSLGQLVTRVASKNGVREYEVRDVDGAVLATINHRPWALLRARRPSWSLHLNDHENGTASGKQGRRPWWLIWGLPMIPLAPFIIFGDWFDPPASMRLRATGRRTVLRYRGLRAVLEITDDWCDQRVAAALLWLIHRNL
ncbi:hypothetical protein [Streptomyces sp. B6B3]|uniref:hypothetical protein n=1 Tax=Streptomyces sp. B6B3 TaxID=3153570 RepID=UPI00325D66E3